MISYLCGNYYDAMFNNAVVGLFNMAYLRDVRIPKERGTSTRFFIHYSNRYAKRRIKMMERIIEEYSQSRITRGCGHRAEDLFVKGLALRGFRPHGPKIKEYNGKKWEKSDHDLDFVFSKDSVDYGCEIKNTLGYIDKEELEIKIDMCKHFEIRPLFIMRYAPKTYMEMIIRGGGFALLYETQIYELGQENLVEKMRGILELPAICSRAIPDGIIDRFERWHDRKKV